MKASFFLAFTEVVDDWSCGEKRIIVCAAARDDQSRNVWKV